jgi:hypothetical protein
LLLGGRQEIAPTLKGRVEACRRFGHDPVGIRSCVAEPLRCRPAVAEQAIQNSAYALPRPFSDRGFRHLFGDFIADGASWFLKIDDLRDPCAQGCPGLRKPNGLQMAFDEVLICKVYRRCSDIPCTTCAGSLKKY